MRWRNPSSYLAGFAVLNIQIEKLKSLVESGAKVKVRDVHGLTPAEIGSKIADQGKRTKILELLGQR